MNFAFIYTTIVLVITMGGAWGYGLLVLPFTLIAHAFLPSAIKGLKRDNSDRLNFTCNIIGLIYCILLSCVLVNN